jgi:hypothetical protein
MSLEIQKHTLTVVTAHERNSLPDWLTEVWSAIRTEKRCYLLVEMTSPRGFEEPWCIRAAGAARVSGSGG